MTLNPESSGHLIQGSTGAVLAVDGREPGPEEIISSRALTEILTASLNELVQWQTEWSGLPDGVTGLSEASGRNISEAQLQASKLTRPDLRPLTQMLAGLGAALAKEIAALRDSWDGTFTGHHPDVVLTAPLSDESLLIFNAGASVWVDGSLASLGDELYIPLSLVNGSFVETFDALVTSDGATVTMSLEQSGGGDLRMQFSDGRLFLDTTPAATIVLTAGSDISPTENFIYVPQSTKVLTKSTSDWPSAEHIKVAYFLVPSAGFVQTNGVYINQNWNDHLSGLDNQGHLLHMAERSRRLGARYFSGIDGNGSSNYVTITSNGGAPDNITVQTTAGTLYQLHKHSYPAKDTSASDIVLVVNDSVTPYDDIMDLNSLLTDASGGSMSNRFFNLVIWGVANKTGEFGALLLNLPNGSYNKQEDAEADISGLDVFAMPSAFDKESSTGFLIARLTFKHSPAASGTWTLIRTLDLRGLAPTNASGGSAVIETTEFADNAFRVFDESDVTKELAFECSGITTGTTRTLTIPDTSSTILVADGTVPLTADWDAGEFAIAANRLLVADADDIVTPSEYVGVGDDQDGRFYAVDGAVHLDAVTSDEDFFLRANDGGVMKNFLEIDASEALLTLGQTGDIMLGADGTVIDVFPETTLEANLGTASKKFNEVRCDRLFASSGVVTAVDTTDVADPPTDANIDSAFGTPAAAGEGFIGIINDNNEDPPLKVWLCAAVKDTWWYEELTKAV